MAFELSSNFRVTYYNQRFGDCDDALFEEWETASGVQYRPYDQPSLVVRDANTQEILGLFWTNNKGEPHRGSLPSVIIHGGEEPHMEWHNNGVLTHLAYPTQVSACSSSNYPKPRYDGQIEEVPSGKGLSATFSTQDFHLSL